MFHRWCRRAVLTCLLAIAIPECNAMDITPPAPLKDCEVFAGASDIAQGFADAASRNIKALLGRTTLSAPLAQFDSRGMRSALETSEQGVTLHYVLYAAQSDGKLAPFSLMNLWSLHSGIVMANTMARMPSPKLQGLKALNQNILVEGAYLAEAYAYASAVCRAGLGPEILLFVRARKVPGAEAIGNPLGIALSTLVVRHKANVEALKHRLRSDVADQPGIAARLAALFPMGLPVWVTSKDEPGARVINDVWFPKQYAEPLMKSLAEEQAKALMTQRKGG